MEQRIKNKIERVGVPLKDWDIQINYGIKTGFNEAFIISGEKRKELIEQDQRSAEIIRPILRGRDIKRYGYEFADLYLICTFPAKHIDIEQYPAVKNHLLSFGKERLEQTGKEYLINGEKIKARKKTNNKWFETQDQIGYWNDFYRQKIVYGQFRRGEFAFDENQCMLSSNEYFICSNTENLKLLLAFLNSKLCYFYGTTMMNNLGGATTIAQKDIFIKTPIPQKIDTDFENQINKLLNEKSYNDIDVVVYQVYGLLKEEINFISSSVS